MIPGGEEAQVKAQKLPVYKKRKCQICCGVAVLLLLALAVVIVVLSQTLFKFRDPRLSIISLKLESISVSVDPFTLSATLNVSVATDLGVTNPNHYDFKYSNSTAVVFYHGLQIGDAALAAGEIRAEKTVALAAVVTVDALKIVEESPDVVSDLESTIVPLNVTSTIPGHVNLAGIFKHHVVATLDCNVEIWINNQTLKDYECTHHVKL
ncbi:hypothetical protein CY35_01G168800 [Sphagnum magellanicum]|jgi:hypothetical protein|nr:hypothetical protein CY35_01G168800 [Sphagnum magellanicum]KAH9576574.1 hypothetical protein CY35_01G168800 [Sphagnum magellanicum]